VFLSKYYDLLFRGEQPALVERRRAQVILFRANVVAGLFAVLTPLWIPIDLWVFPTRLGLYFSALRIIASLAFVALILVYRYASSIMAAHHALAGLLAVPTIFFLVCQPLLGQFEFAGQVEQAVAAGYSFLPFVMVAGLAVFPITAMEGALLCIPLWLSTLTVAYLGYHILPFETYLGAMWLLALLSVVSTLAGMSQLHFMQQLITQSSHDALTGAYNRQIGEELLEIHFSLARRTNKPFTLAFVDLDNFKTVNDKFGHDAGDVVLKDSAEFLHNLLRNTDILIRWGGEEFLIAMPNTDLEGARVPLSRLRAQGLGLRPDGTQITASIGACERQTEECPNWQALVDKADHRMYIAKQTGKNRVVYEDASDPEPLLPL